MSERRGGRDVTPEMAKRIDAFVKSVEEARSRQGASQVNNVDDPKQPNPDKAESVSMRSPDGMDMITMCLQPGEEGKRTARGVLDYLAAEQKARESGER